MHQRTHARDRAATESTQPLAPQPQPQNRAPSPAGGDSFSLDGSAVWVGNESGLDAAGSGLPPGAPVPGAHEDAVAVLVVHLARRRGRGRGRGGGGGRADDDRLFVRDMMRAIALERYKVKVCDMKQPPFDPMTRLFRLLSVIAREWI